ncbi:aldose 1-epimerase family protein [Changchengzhania lutea]|uniref:aldose 1-epimerase family protein n=1 Tax=Changchengzhania lutea TaxID=2049305 RepID=UPI00115EE4C7|nr:aldose 1-epimerase family protein [Changchengzhania lutea]
MFSLENDQLKINVLQTGAELCGITAVKTGTEFMWHADPDIWGSFAPNLFPIIGALKNNTYFYDNQSYQLPKHGFVRNNAHVKLYQQTKNSLIFTLSSDADLLKSYPFHFEFYITYTLKNNIIEVLHTVKNIDTKTMYFSVGGHPAFKCPVFDNERYDDYVLEFEHLESVKRHHINMENGLISSNTETVLKHSNQIPLTHDLFDKDALVFKDLKSKQVTLKSKTHGAILSVHYEPFPYLGIWAKPTGNYVCIEPWLGVADHEDSNQQLKEKEGIIALDAGKTFEANYRIEIHPKHLA